MAVCAQHVNGLFEGNRVDSIQQANIAKDLINQRNSSWLCDAALVAQILLQGLDAEQMH